jgi:hypothetical protein
MYLQLLVPQVNQQPVSRFFGANRFFFIDAPL